MSLLSHLLSHWMIPSLVFTPSFGLPEVNQQLLNNSSILQPNISLRTSEITDKDADLLDSSEQTTPAVGLISNILVGSPFIWLSDGRTFSAKPSARTQHGGAAAARTSPVGSTAARPPPALARLTRVSRVMPRLDGSPTPNRGVATRPSPFTFFQPPHYCLCSLWVQSVFSPNSIHFILSHFLS